MNPVSGGVAWVAGVDDGDAPPGAPEHQGGAETGGSAADNDDVEGVGRIRHVFRMERIPQTSKKAC
ncbi:hypothetical protein GCM10027403_32820 [Arthrobacter tecti]